LLRSFCFAETNLEEVQSVCVLYFVPDLVTQKRKNEAEASPTLPGSLGSVPVTIACRPKLKEINCRIVNERPEPTQRPSRRRSDVLARRAKSSRPYAGVNGSVRENYSSTFSPGKMKLFRFAPPPASPPGRRWTARLAGGHGGRRPHGNRPFSRCLEWKKGREDFPTDSYRSAASKTGRSRRCPSRSTVIRT